MRRFPNVPPFQYLLGFEAAARLGSFSAAAEELGLTQSAISHQIRLLEERIGWSLFIRTGRGITLNDAGRDYWRTVSASLEALENGYHRLAPFGKAGSVIVYMPRDFGDLWFMPRLPKLHEDLPHIQPWIDTSGKFVDFDEMDVHIAVVRAREPNPGFLCFKIADDIRKPVLAPSLAARFGASQADFQAIPRLHDERPEGWRDLFKTLGFDLANIATGLDFSDPSMALRAAEAGLGMALASVPMAADAIAAGRLVAPFDVFIETGLSWFAVTQRSALAERDVADIWSWLKGEV